MTEPRKVLKRTTQFSDARKARDASQAVWIRRGVIGVVIVTAFWALEQSSRQSAYQSVGGAQSARQQVVVTTDESMNALIAESEQERASQSESDKQAIREKWLRDFLAVVVSVDSEGVLVTSADIDESFDQRIIVTVPNSFHYQPYPIRLQFTQAIHKLWVGVRDPESPHNPEISLRDVSGNEIGGTKLLGGVWVVEG
ncbi:MAG: hypothetical protein ACYTGL_23735 [Planctomycetota bacterium]